MSSLTRFFVTDQPLSIGREVKLAPDDAYHAVKVMRLRQGDKVELSDGKGNAYRAELVTARSSGADASVKETLESNESPVNITLVQSFLKGQKMDLVVRQAVELGVKRIIPLISSRSIPDLKGERVGTRVDRWQKIARSAASQCRRSVIPALEAPVSWEELLTHIPSAAINLLFWEEKGDDDLLKNLPASPDNITVIIGPEGGFRQDEVDAIKQKGALSVGLGPRILRAETAAAVAVSMVQFLLGDLGGAKF